MLILSYTDGLRVNLHQFCQRVHQAAADRYSPTHRHVIVRKLIASYLRSRVDRCSLFTHHKHLHVSAESLPFQEIFCLAACRPVADGNGIYFISLYHCLYLGKSLFGLVDRRVRVNIFVVQQVTLFVQAYHFTSRSESGVYAHHPFPAQRWSQQQLPQVGGKNADGLVVGLFFA